MPVRVYAHKYMKAPLTKSLYETRNAPNKLYNTERLCYIRSTVFSLTLREADGSMAFILDVTRGICACIY